MQDTLLLLAALVATALLLLLLHPQPPGVMRVQMVAQPHLSAPHHPTA